MSVSAAPSLMAPLRLGFGCSSLGSEIEYAEGCALVAAAFDAGFRHFDVAPPYGNGMAERILGDVLAPVRAQITLVSKAGIAHPRQAGLLQGLRRLALPVKRRFPAFWGRAAQRARQYASPNGRFDSSEIHASLDESLRRLRTDHLDALLLHEVLPLDIADELLQTLRGLRAEGHVRALGTGTSIASSLELRASHGDLFSWIQVPHHWGAFEGGLREVPQLITHRSLRAGIGILQTPAFRSALAAEPAVSVRAEIERRVADPTAGAALLLRAALAQVGPHGRVLVSTLQRERIPGLVEAGRCDPTPALGVALNQAFARCVSAAADPGQAMA